MLLKQIRNRSLLDWSSINGNTRRMIMNYTRIFKVCSDVTNGTMIGLVSVFSNATLFSHDKWLFFYFLLATRRWNFLELYSDLICWSHKALNFWWWNYDLLCLSIISWSLIWSSITLILRFLGNWYNNWVVVVLPIFNGCGLSLNLLEKGFWFILCNFR